MTGLEIMAFGAILVVLILMDLIVAADAHGETTPDKFEQMPNRLYLKTPRGITGNAEIKRNRGGNSGANTR